MSIALATMAALTSPLQQVMGWLNPTRITRTPFNPAPGQDAYLGRWKARDRATPTRASGAGGSVRHPTAPRPLRVVRILESGQASTGAGRMVMSGRLADVCAELDRLAARESAKR